MEWNWAEFLYIFYCWLVGYLTYADRRSDTVMLAPDTWQARGATRK